MQFFYEKEGDRREIQPMLEGEKRKGKRPQGKKISKNRSRKREKDTGRSLPVGRGVRKIPSKVRDLRRRRGSDPIS